jgi:DNA-binding transcriptional ArsR family regulator
VNTNTSILEQPEEKISKLLSLIGQPARIQILLLLGKQEACVCHLEAALGMRQASISQHLMALRKAELVTSQREGRNIFYQLASPEVIQILEQAAQMVGVTGDSLHNLHVSPAPGCPCPKCNPGIDPDLTCQNLRSQTK